MSSNPVLAALGRLEAAVGRLEDAARSRTTAVALQMPVASAVPADGAVARRGSVDNERELERLRAENAELSVAADTVSERLEKTIERLKNLLDA